MNADADSQTSIECRASRQSDAKSVCFVITGLARGGAEAQVISLARGLQSRGWRATIVSLLDNNEHERELELAEIATYRLGMTRGVPDPRGIWRLRKLLTQLRPSVVHAHMFHANILSRATQLIGKRFALICTAHNVQERSERDGATWQRELLYRATNSLSDITTTMCEAGYRRYLKIGVAPARDLKMVANGIDTDRFRRDSHSRGEARQRLSLGDEFIWLAIGRLVPQKDFRSTLNAAAALPQKGWRLLIAGTGPLASELESLASRLGLSDRVVFLGAMSDTRELYNAADALVMSSKYEGLSMVLLEASAMELPCVVTDVGGNCEVVLDGRTGFVVPAEEPRQLAEQLNRMMNLSPAERWKLGAAARQHCVHFFDLDNLLNTWERLYTAVAAKAQLS